MYLIWGSTYIAIKFALETMPPCFLGAVRFTGAGLLMCLLAVLRKEPRPSFEQLRSAAVLGMLLLVFGSMGVVFAERTVPSGLVSLLVTSVPIYIVLLQWILPGSLGRAPSLKVLLGLAFGVFGLSLLLDLDTIFGAEKIDPVGAAWVLIGAFGSACGALYTRVARVHQSKIYSVGLQMSFAGLFLLLASFATGEFLHIDLHGITAKSLWSLLYLAVFGSIIAFSAYVYLLQNVSPSRVATYAYVNPVVAVLLGWLLGGEAVTTRTLVSAVVVIAAVWMINTGQHKSFLAPRLERKMKGK